MKEKLKIIALLLLIIHFITAWILLDSDFFYKPLIINDLVYAWFPAMVILTNVIYMIVKKTYKDSLSILMIVVSVLTIALYWHTLSLFFGHK